MKRLIKTIPIVLIFCMSVTSVLSVLSEFSSSTAASFAGYNRDASGLKNSKGFNQLRNEHTAMIAAYGHSTSNRGNLQPFFLAEKAGKLKVENKSYVIGDY